MKTENNLEVEITKKTKTNILIIALALTFGSLPQVRFNGFVELLGGICGGSVMWYFILYGIVYVYNWFKIQYSD
jgi:hypothetical protein